jgi:hypothetical protein
MKKFADAVVPTATGSLMAGSCFVLPVFGIIEIAERLS